MSAATTKPRILVIGGYGVFGGRLSRRLAKHDDVEVIVAGRRLDQAEAHCREYGGRAALLETSVGNLDAAIGAFAPDVVVDAAGPFQTYGADPYRLARAALRSGAHYLDLADDAAFVAGIGALDREAQQAGRVALSGCSSVPAISSAAIDALTADMTTIDSIESTIMPGNRAPRGRSVVEAILAQAGKSVRVRKAGEWVSAFGWCSVTRREPAIAGVEALGKRYVSPIGAPDLLIFPERFGARTVRFQAGLELAVMHLGLAGLAWLVRLGLLRTATVWTGPLLWCAERLKPFGTDRGAMVVDVIGRGRDGGAEHARWTLIAEAGDGPEIPSTPAYLLALRLCREPQQVPAGARACVGDLTLGDIDDGLAPFAITTTVTRETFETVFAAALQDELQALPDALRDLHDVLDLRAFVGSSSVERGKGWLSRAIGWFMGFPPAGDDVSVRVDMQRKGTGEVWVRRFDSARFRSHLTRRNGAPTGEIWERFGVLSCRIKLRRTGDELRYPVDAVRLFGLVPLPQFLVPTSDTREYVDDDGNAAFDVSISHPLAGFIVRYHGWVQPIEADMVLEDYEESGH